MRVLILFAFVAYAVAAPHDIPAEEPLTNQPINQSDDVEAANIDAQVQAEDAARALADNIRELDEQANENVNAGVDEANVLEKVTEEPQLEERAEVADPTKAPLEETTDSIEGTTENVHEGVSEANDVSKDLAEEARWAAEERKWQEQAEAEGAAAKVAETGDSIETTATPDDTNEGVAVANDLTHEIAGEAQWQAEEKKWQELAEAEAAAAKLDGTSDSVEVTASPEDANEGVEVANDLTHEIAGEAVWQSEEKKWQELANAEANQAKLAGDAAHVESPIPQIFTAQAPEIKYDVPEASINNIYLSSLIHGYSQRNPWRTSRISPFPYWVSPIDNVNWGYSRYVVPSWPQTYY